MEKREIIKEIINGLECLTKENPRELIFMLDYYEDTYYEDSISALILKWEQSGYGNFDEIFPVTANVVTKLEQVNDGVERPREVYANIIASAKDALKEVREYKIS
ncbi:hypothetical protein IKF32_00735 [Candidatus Saccharibacteria bacterium]|nr:hypothetical protein [Candidatus Saccharibacteria bacterium]